MGKQNNTEHNYNKRDVSLENLIAQVECANTKNYIQNRILQQMEWYSRKSSENKRKYFFWMTSAIILGAMIPVASVFADGAIWVKALIATLGATVAACNSYISLHNYKDLWFTYRNTREVLLRILYSYFFDAGVFKKIEEYREKDAILIELCEETLSQEVGDWFSLVKKQ